MEEHTLKGEYISVLKDGRLSYGGSQRWSDSGSAGVWLRGHRGPGPAAVSGAAAGGRLSAVDAGRGAGAPGPCTTGGPDS